MNTPAVQDEDSLITLADGSTLDARQSRAIRLHVLHDLSHDEIAEQAGYASGSSVSSLLNSRKGEEGVRVALIQHLTHGATVALKTMITLAKSAKSENVRQLAAADLLNRARIELADMGDGPKRGSGSFTININAGGEQVGLTIDGEAGQ